jgi:hypothetical protein
LARELQKKRKKLDTKKNLKKSLTGKIARAKIHVDFKYKGETK